jgi:hypothetical protein
MPPLVIIFENPIFLKVSSIFETRNFITIKLLILFNKNFNFLEILVTSIVLNIFECFFIKKYYIKNNLMGIEIKDKKLRKINQFKMNFKLLISGYLIATLWFSFVFNKLEFYFFDQSK